MDLSDLRQSMLALLADCSGVRCERARVRLQQAGSAQELWLARSEIFQLLASQHCQSQAAARINALLPAFEGWLPPRMLVPV
jgi:hypothetical protein